MQLHSTMTVSLHRKMHNMAIKQRGWVILLVPSLKTFGKLWSNILSERRLQESSLIMDFGFNSLIFYRPRNIFVGPSQLIRSFSVLRCAVGHSRLLLCCCVMSHGVSECCCQLSSPPTAPLQWVSSGWGLGAESPSGPALKLDDQKQNKDTFRDSETCSR